MDAVQAAGERDDSANSAAIPTTNFVRCENRSSGDANELAGESRSIAISHPSSVTFTS
jgi:hypothetical protein